MVIYLQFNCNAFDKGAGEDFTRTFGTPYNLALLKGDNGNIDETIFFARNFRSAYFKKQESLNATLMDVVDLTTEPVDTNKVLVDSIPQLLLTTILAKVNTTGAYKGPMTLIFDDPSNVEIGLTFLNPFLRTEDIAKLLVDEDLKKFYDSIN